MLLKFSLLRSRSHSTNSGGKGKQNKNMYGVSLYTSADTKACDTANYCKALWQMGQNAQWVFLALTMLDYLDVSLF